jgi:hypothetical protein
VVLILSVLLGASAAGKAMMDIVSGQPNLTASITSNSKSWDASAQGQLTGLRPQDDISIVLTGIHQNHTSQLLAQQVSRAGSQGNASVSLTVKALEGYMEYRFDVRAPSMICSVILTPASTVVKSTRTFICSNS